MPLFTPQELSDYVQEDVPPATAAKVEQVVWGWLQGPLGLETRPDPVPDNIYGWALELGGIAFRNPTSDDSYQLGQERFGFGATQAARRSEILAAAAAGSADGGSSAGPQGCFPEPDSWPDPHFGGPLYIRAW